MRDTFSIGDLARMARVKIPTIRYYESVGLVPLPPRTESNRRLYGRPDVDRLRFIRHARELGFEMEAIHELLALAEQPQRSCTKVDALAREHLADIASRIDRLTALKMEIERMIQACARGRIGQCRIIDVLSHDERETQVALREGPSSKRRSKV